MTALYNKISELKALIVDESDFAASNIKSAMFENGISDIQIAKKVERITSLLKQNKKKSLFDLIILDFDIARYDVSQNVLEEIKSLSKTCCLIITSSNPSRENLIRILEIEPDDIILKPYKVNTLKKRIQTNARNLVMTTEIRQALDAQDNYLAIEKVSEVERRQEYAGHRKWLNKIKIKAMFENKMYDNVENATRSFLSVGESEWARTYLAKSLLLSNQFERALEESTVALQKHPASLNSYILMGESLSSLSRHDEASTYFEKALKIKPDSIDAMKGLSESSAHDKNYKKAIDNYSKLIDLVEGTVEETPDLYVEVANLKKEQGEAEISTHLIHAINDGFSFLQRGKESFPDCELIAANHEIMKAAKFLEHGKKEKSVQILNSCFIKYRNHILESPSTALNMIVMYDNLKEDHMATSIIEELERREDKKTKRHKARVNSVKQLVTNRISAYNDKASEIRQTTSSVVNNAKKMLGERRFKEAYEYVSKVCIANKGMDHLLILNIKIANLLCKREGNTSEAISCFKEAVRLAREQAFKDDTIQQINKLVRARESIIKRAA